MKDIKGGMQTAESRMTRLFASFGATEKVKKSRTLKISMTLGKEVHHASNEAHYIKWIAIKKYV